MNVSKSMIGVGVDRGFVMVAFGNCLLRDESLDSLIRISAEPRIKLYRLSFN